ncbi:MULTISPECIES: EutN/CcmL family microcompartment protein [Desulfoluna]|uniref:Ethanolamine utilization protein EutN n=2 Tax=Desulfoluna TaxID=497721 RepID=A0A1G5JLN8_9BACT|nr:MULTISPECIES: EutN/CcmL family microcompartment protein [Desulfoluna]SCY89322.1 ethanolamine utilization protein EutN [Desulfoluna spongiiphila]VFQ45057.1 ethanolamine utilization protein eutn/carboxysome structural protein ccml [Desulfoluna butyratoxydans]
MIVGKVIGNVWATRKEDGLSGMKLMVVRRLDACTNEELDSLVAVDFIGAGIGDRVLVTTGSSARNAGSISDAPVDATIVGIIDEVEVQEGM